MLLTAGIFVAVTMVPLAAFLERWPRRTVLAALLGAYATRLRRTG